MQYAPQQYAPQQYSQSPYMDSPITMPMSMGMPMSKPPINPALIVLGVILVLSIFGGGGYAIYYYTVSKPAAAKAAAAAAAAAPAATPAATPNTSSNTMKEDINYAKIMKLYNATTGFGNEINTAITIVGNFMAANKLPGTPINIPAANLYLILNASNADSAFNEIMKVVPTTIMQEDANYRYVLQQYIPGKGFGDAIRNMAIIIVGNFMAANGISGNSPQSFSDEKLYNILKANSPTAAKTLLLK